MVGNGFRLDPDFRKLWIGQAISQIGSNITGVGLPLTAVLVLKASPLQMGFLSGVGAAAVLIFGLFAGAWVDRLRRRPILIAADLGRAVVLGMIPLAAMLHRLTIGDLYLVAVGSSILTVLFRRELPGVSALAYRAREHPYRKQPAGFDRVDCADRRSRYRRHPGATDHGAHGHAVRRCVVRLFRRLSVAHPQTGTGAHAHPGTPYRPGDLGGSGRVVARSIA